MATTTTDSKTALKSTRCRLLELPAELRIIIYEEHFRAAPIDLQKIYDNKSLPTPALLLTSKATRAEAGLTYFDCIYSAIGEIRERQATIEIRCDRLGERRERAASAAEKRGLSLRLLQSKQERLKLYNVYLRAERLMCGELARWREEGFEYNKR